MGRKQRGSSVAIRVGIGGWVFEAWRGSFYPPGLAKAGELRYASRRLTSIEINATFYGAQKPESFRRWYGEAPDDFVFSVKGPRFATHRADLAGAGPSIGRLFGSGIMELKEKLGPVLWQFPPSTRFDEAGFAAFLALLPPEIDGYRIRHAIEVRHRSFADPSFIALLRRYRAALVFVDGEKYPALHDVTADFIYARLRRSLAAEPAGYPAAELDGWAERFRLWAGGSEPADAVRCQAEPAAQGRRDCFVYFINGAKERAPAAAMALIERLAR